MYMDIFEIVALIFSASSTFPLEEETKLFENNNFYNHAHCSLVNVKNVRFGNFMATDQVVAL